MSSENVEPTQMFTSLGSMIHSPTGCQQAVGVNGRNSLAQPKLVRKNEGSSFSCSSSAGLAVSLPDLDSDRRAETESELLWYYRSKRGYYKNKA